jgi:hypothetical protein
MTPKDYDKRDWENGLYIVVVRRRTICTSNNFPIADEMKLRRTPMRAARCQPARPCVGLPVGVVAMECSIVLNLNESDTRMGWLHADLAGHRRLRLRVLSLAQPTHAPYGALARCRRVGNDTGFAP